MIFFAAFLCVISAKEAERTASLPKGGRFDMLLGEMNTFKTNVNKYEEDVRKLGADREAQSEELNELKKEIELLKLDNANYISRILDLKERISMEGESAKNAKKLEEKLGTAEGELQESKGKIKQLQTENRNNAELKVQMEADIERAKEKAELLSDQLKMSEDMFEELKQTKKSLGDELARSKDVIVKLENKIGEYEARIA